MDLLSSGRILIIDDRKNEDLQIFISLLSDRKIETAIESDLGTAIHRVQTDNFDAVVLDAKVSGMPVERTIQILKNIDPKMKIIVKTDNNSKDLEAKVRQETIYYYHLSSFGWDDLKLAVESAIRQKALDCKKEDFAAFAFAEDKRLVLMVDENEAFIEIHKTNLEQHNFKVRVCYDADEAMELIRRKKPDLLMVDINIPVGSEGEHFLEMVMRNSELVAIPMLIFVDEESAAKYVKVLDQVRNSLPTLTFLEKPVKIEDVIPRVEKMLRIKVQADF